MIAALCIRRFNVKANGQAHVIEAARLLDLAALPLHGYALIFEDGSGEAGVAAVVIHCSDVNRAPGFYPPSVEIKTGKEPADRLEAALLAGWQRLEPTEPLAR